MKPPAKRQHPDRPLTREVRCSALLGSGTETTQCEHPATRPDGLCGIHGRTVDLAVGDRIEVQDGPFLSTWEVVELIDAGARLAYQGDVRFVGYKHPSIAPDGTYLTRDREQGFLGRAHWRSARRVSR